MLPVCICAVRGEGLKMITTLSGGLFSSVHLSKGSERRKLRLKEVLSVLLKVRADKEEV